MHSSFLSLSFSLQRLPFKSSGITILYWQTTWVLPTFLLGWTIINPHKKPTDGLTQSWSSRSNHGKHSLSIPFIQNSVHSMRFNKGLQPQQHITFSLSQHYSPRNTGTRTASVCWSEAKEMFKTNFVTMPEIHCPKHGCYSHASSLLPGGKKRKDMIVPSPKYLKKVVLFTVFPG